MLLALESKPEFGPRDTWYHVRLLGVLTTCARMSEQEAFLILQVVDARSFRNKAELMIVELPEEAVESFQSASHKEGFDFHQVSEAQYCRDEFVEMTAYRHLPRR